VSIRQFALRPLDQHPFASEGRSVPGPAGEGLRAGVLKVLGVVHEEVDAVRAAAELTRRRRSEGSKRRSQQRRFYLRGIVHCATGHDPLRMHGKERKGITYYACSYRISYGDKAAEALGHGKWQYAREDLVLPLIDRFFEQHVFGPERVACFREQHGALLAEVSGESDDERRRLERQLADLDQRNRTPGPGNRGGRRSRHRPPAHRGAKG
jgi:hypothetical protein